ncbi:MAG: signal peptidase II [Deltaproteobacteria bacterium]|nr:signal peptidase II [Deltaproteobacteria bacterium]
MDKKYIPLFTFAPVIIILDQLVKIYVDKTMHLYQSIEVLENFFHITYIRNKGAAFGILSGANESLRVPFFLTVSAIAVVVIIYTIYTYREESPLFPFAMAMILGGAIGNVIDRIRLGEVIDYIDVHWYTHHWPAFNVADSAITAGVVLLIISMLFEHKKAESEEENS